MKTISEKELNEYLESIGGLENGWRIDGPTIKDCKAFSIGEGWYGLIKSLIEELVVLGWNKQITQVKEKFGSLRFYTSETTQEMQTVINKYEDLSAETCEHCGNQGKIEPKNGWLECVCGEHKYEPSKL